MNQRLIGKITGLVTVFLTALLLPGLAIAEAVAQTPLNLTNSLF